MEKVDAAIVLLEERSVDFFGDNRSRGKHVNGEWFGLSSQDVAALKTLPSPLPSARFAEILKTLRPAAGHQQG